MQLILDCDHIDIQRNMSIIDQEPLTEKLLNNKVIEHLADDITSGNKENIQKQNNIIPEIEQDNVIDIDKEIPSIGDEISTSNLNKEKSKLDPADNEDVKLSNENTENESVERNPTKVHDDLINGTLNKEEFRNVENEVQYGAVQNDSPKEELKEDSVDLDINRNDPVPDDCTLLKNEAMVKISADDLIGKNEIELNDNLVLPNVLAEEQEENKEDLDKEVDISELSTELNEEKAMDLDKEVDVSEVSTGSNDENVIHLDENVNTDTDMKLGKTSDQNEVPEIILDDKSQDDDCTEIEIKSIAIEIDDEDEKVNEKCLESEKPFQEIDEKEVNLNKEPKSSPENTTTKIGSEEQPQPKRICRLSNNLDIFSDEEDDDTPGVETPKDDTPSPTEKQCINIDDDDDIMLIDEDSSVKDKKTEDTTIKDDLNSISDNVQPIAEITNQSISEIKEPIIENKEVTETMEEIPPSETENKDIIESSKNSYDDANASKNENAVETSEETETNKKPLLPKNFVKTCKKNLADMTRDDLEEFCILKIVESIVDRSNLGEIKTQLKNLTQTMEECKKKCLMLSKQNKDLQVVLKSVQEEQKSGSDVHITPLKITRSVGMQVVMVADKNVQRKKSINGVGVQSPTPNNNNKQNKSQPVQKENTRNQKEKTPTNQQIPVPRLVPATAAAGKNIQTASNNNITKQTNTNALQNGLRVLPTTPKSAEKRGRSQAVTVDLTDDEPPSKLPNIQKGPMNQPMRVLTTAPNLLPNPRFAQNVNTPRKVYIPISGPQAQNVRPGQTIMLKTLSSLGPRPRATPPHVAKVPQASIPVRYGRGQVNKHPAPLPVAMKQCQPPNWKSLPPAPDLKLSKVENGIVISWKIDDYQEDNHEEIASYQLYAYQETLSPPNTALWKKIGDVKALPLPMACTLTQFMAGYKYYFAVRAVDVRSRFGPFSTPGSILLLNKM